MSSGRRQIGAGFRRHGALGDGGRERVPAVRYRRRLRRSGRGLATGNLADRELWRVVTGRHDGASALRMCVAIVALTMFILPIASIGIEHAMRPEAPLPILIGRWFVFWAVGIRLGLAGLRRTLQPAFRRARSSTCAATRPCRSSASSASPTWPTPWSAWPPSSPLLCAGGRDLGRTVLRSGGARPRRRTKPIAQREPGHGERSFHRSGAGRSS